MNKIKIRVFPDYCACAFWQHPDQGHANLDYDMFEDIIPKPILIAFKYWVQIWELCSDEYSDSTMSKRYHNEWQQDGIALTKAMNDCQDVYDFVYVKDEYCR